MPTKRTKPKTKRKLGPVPNPVMRGTRGAVFVPKRPRRRARLTAVELEGVLAAQSRTLDEFRRSIAALRSRQEQLTADLDRVPTEVRVRDESGRVAVLEATGLRVLDACGEQVLAATVMRLPRGDLGRVCVREPSGASWILDAEWFEQRTAERDALEQRLADAEARLAKLMRYHPSLSEG